jgi:hypothetical protein
VFASEPWAGEGRFLGTFAFAKFFEFFMKRLLTLKLCPNYIPATGDDVASRAAVWWRLSSRFDSFMASWPKARQKTLCR